MSDDVGARIRAEMARRDLLADRTAEVAAAMDRYAPPARRLRAV